MLVLTNYTIILPKITKIINEIGKQTLLNEGNKTEIIIEIMK